MSRIFDRTDYNADILTINDFINNYVKNCKDGTVYINETSISYEDGSIKIVAPRSWTRLSAEGVNADLIYNAFISVSK